MKHATLLLAKLSWMAIFGCVAASMASPAVAQEVIPDFYKGAGLDPNRSYVNQNFSEHIDPFNGSLQLHYVDINLPGNGGFDLQVTRSYNSAQVNESNPNAFFGSAGVGWTVHFGRVLYKTSVGPCGGTSSADTLRDPVLELPDGSTQLLVATGGTSPTLISAQRWRADCAVNGVTVYSPSGVRYDMTQSVPIASGQTGYYTTQITDRNGNTANVAYTQAGSPEVSNVTTSDSRRIDFAYYALASGEITRRISTVTSQDSLGGHTYLYGYTAVGGTFSAYQLTSVTRPDVTRWQYAYLGNLNATAPGGFQLNRVTYPQGGFINYSYGNTSSDYVQFDQFANNALARTSAIKSKSTSDGGNWSFTYTPGNIGVLDRTTVNTPSGTVNYTHVGPNYAASGSLWTVGTLIQKTIGSVQTESYTWTPQVISTQQFKRPGAFFTRFDPNTSAPLLSSKTIQRDGSNYTTNVDAYDTYGNPTSVRESGPGGGSRTTSNSYHIDLSRWIVNQIMDQVITGGVSIRRIFVPPGNLQSITRDTVTTSYQYDSQGNVSQATFPRTLNHFYSSYYRGIPRTGNQPEGVNLSRTVSDSGNVTAETNGASFTTRFGYDGLNRLTSISPPSGNSTSISYGAASKSASRGTLPESTQYDGFGRPASVTLGGVARSYGYDSLGRLTFASNPGSGSGTSYQYDMLDRVTFVSNADGTNRSISFGGGSKSVRDERNYSTTYNYRAYGDPNQQWLMSVSAPDPLANITIGRNARDQVLSVAQGGFTRSYGYDGRGFLTLVTNPETGQTTYGRDDANNMTTRAVGSSGQTIFGYDLQNRLATASYPGTTPSVTKTYTGTHKLKTVTTSAAARTYNYDSNDNLTGEQLDIDGYGFSGDVPLVVATGGGA